MICVAAVIAAVVLGGIGLDKVIAAPSGGGVELQKANVELTIAATPYTGTADAALQDAEQALSADAAQISFGDPVDKPIGGHVAAAAGFEAIVSGSSGSGTVDGELVCVLDGGDAVEFVVATSQGDLSSVTDDLKAMISSVEVGR
jgi:hypothetical protein